MPGLSQLKKFNSDLLSLGDEVNLRAARGEKPVRIEIPKDVQDVNDSEEFVLGMPINETEVEVAPAEEDLSDLSALINPTAASDNKGEAAPVPSFEAPDMSALLNPVAPPADDDSGMPDLSMFDEVEEEPEEVVEEEPEEISIADMGLDALLAGGGFDEPSEEPEESSEEGTDDLDLGSGSDAETTDFDLESFTQTPDLDDIENAEPAEDIPEAEPEPLEAVKSFDEPESLDEPEPLEESEPLETTETLDDIAPLGDIENLGGAEPFDEPETLGESESFDIPETTESFDEPASLTEPVSSDTSDFDSFDLPDSFDIPETTEDAAGDAAVEEAAPLEDAESLDEAAPLDLNDASGEPGAPLDLDSFDLPDSFDVPEAADNVSAETVQETADGIGGAEPLEDLGSLDDFGSFDEPAPLDDAVATDESVSAEEAVPAAEGAAEDFGADAGEGLEAVDFDTDGLDTADFDDAAATDNATDEESASTPEGLFDVGDFDLDNIGEAPAGGADLSAEDEIPDSDFDTAGLDDTNGFDDEGGDGTDGIDENAPLEVFDTSDMEGMDFGIQDTDSQIGGGEGDFEFGQQDDFAMEGEFEIPGFSDVETAKEEKSSKPKLTSGKEKGKKGKGKNLPQDVEKVEVAEELPPNTLSDEQYKIFLENLAEYPLNVRLAFEDFIVQDEFTDDAEFELIEKILNKAPARQVAGMLEKMLDTSIPIPRDFEHRTAAEYEAYKKSLSYQLRNKIIPGILLGIVLMIVGWGLFKFGDYCIYRPLKANSLYKQGYALLQADEYPQAEMRFEEAVKRRINKKWFFRYARGYREHKQYQRAGKMYENILRYFKHDKAAGLEYADMELEDLANYQRAEEIVRREVLDYHINDAEGILKLGDIFLEWGTEKNPSKLELAREQYATLIQLYSPTDLYMSRMMRYFIRTDNLREVIQMQKNFEQREKSLGSDDWAELSGYLLDKYYGALAPSEEYLRYEIEGLRNLLLRAVKTNPNNPIALYNLSKYFIKTGETAAIESTLQNTIEKFNEVPSMKKRDLYKYIDAYKLLGEHYIGTTDYLQAQEQFAEGISLFTTERDNAGFEGTPAIGELYKDMGDIKYSISGDYDDALFNYKYSVELENDSPSIRYRIGYIQYKKKNYAEALGAFMKAGDGNIKERNLMLAMANTLYLRGDDYAAQGYYSQLIDSLDLEIAENGLVFPQANIKDYDLVNTYLYASNNYGVTLYKLAKRTGNSALNAQAIVEFSQSVRAWDALTRNLDTMVRLEGSNLAEQNIKYITHPIPEFEPSIYTDLSKTLLDNERL